MVVQGFPVSNAQPGNRYTFSAWVKAQNIRARVPFEIELRALGANGEAVLPESRKLSVKSDTDWKLVSTDFSLPVGTTKLSLSLIVKPRSEATVWVDDIAVREQPLFFEQPLRATLRASSKKVFAHYFTPFPVSLDNGDPKSDYYTQYLSPDGEGGSHRGQGGFLRERPLGRASRPLPDPAWVQADFDEEVSRAVALGLDGFVADLLGYAPDKSDYNWNRVKMLLQSAQRVDGGFKIMAMPDMTAGLAGPNVADKLTAAITEFNSYPAAYRLADGRLVVAPYLVEMQTPAWWKAWLDSMKAKGINIAFVPLFQGWEKDAPSYASLCDGMSDWGFRSPKSNASWVDVPKKAHHYAPIWMMPVAPQDMRPNASLYTEAGNSENFRVMWQNAIQGGADWVQLITWNDYSESAEVSPSTGTQYGFYDLAAYYTTWFKTGKMPKITRDTLFYFHRIHPTTAAPDLTKQTSAYRLADAEVPRNDIELLAFLVTPGTLQIQIGGKTQQLQAPAGMTSFRIPIQNGRPSFSLLRGGKTVVALDSAFTISDKIVYDDLLYRSGGSNRAPVVTTP